MNVLDKKTDKFNDPELAQALWPTYLETGSLDAVHRQAGEIGQKVSKPTLIKLIDYFGWKEIREKELKQTFTAMLDREGDLEAMYADLVAIKNSLGASVKATVDKDLHGIYGGYVAQIMKLSEMIERRKSVDKTQLLIRALKAVVRFLQESGMDAAAALLSDSLEYVAKRIEAAWQE